MMKKRCTHVRTHPLDLPVEILLHIFSYLPFSFQIELRTVSVPFYKTLKESVFRCEELNTRFNECDADLIVYTDPSGDPLGVLCKRHLKEDEYICSKCCSLFCVDGHRCLCNE